MNSLIRRLSSGVAALILLAGCGDSAGTGGSAQLVVRLTDAPIDNVQSATIWVSSVYLIGGSDSTGNRFVVMDTAAMYDVLTLTDGVTALVGDVTVPSGTYTQMRMVVDSARVTLKNITFSDGSTSKTMKTPSGQQSGIKVNFSGPVNIDPGQTVLVVDFDVSRNFVFTGPKTSPNGVIFKPVLHATVSDVAGSITGTVTPLTSKASLFAIMGTDTVTSAVADSVTGVYKLWYLPPGSYTVAATATGLVSQTKTATVGDGQNVTGVDFALIP